MYEVYGTSDCRFCHEATDMLESFGLPYEYKEIDTSQTAFDEFRQRLPTARTVPQIYKNGVHIGSSMEDLTKELRNAT